MAEEWWQKHCEEYDQDFMLLHAPKCKTCKATKEHCRKNGDKYPGCFVGE